jgi:nickel-dependent lactate racemase
VSVPAGLRVRELVPGVLRARPDETAVEAALGAPAEAPPLAELAGGRRSALVVIPDKTRAAGAKLYLPPVLSALSRGGMDPGNISLITANGAHPRLSEDELLGIVGREIMDDYAVGQHDSRDDARMVEIGVTRRGTPVRVNRLCLESDLVVLTGSVSFHYFAGFGGGRKTCFPGLAAYDSIVANHRLTLGTGAGLDPRCGPGALEGNPVHEDIMEAFSMLPPPFVLNTVVAPAGGIVAAFAGAHDPVFRSVCECARRFFSVEVERGADIVVASCGGHPYDINLLQMHKGLRNAALCARDGGQLVLAAKGAQGVGSATLEEGLTRGSWREADRAARSSYVLNAHTAVALLQQAARVSIHMVSEVRELECARSWARHYMDGQAAFDAALAAAGSKSPTIYYMPLAGITVPLPVS